MEGDLDATTFHLGVFDSDQLIGVASFMPHALPRFKGLHYQLRGMAILEAYQGKALGRELLQAGEKHLRSLNIELLWCNARIKALNFYLRLGFTIEGDPFEIPDVGTHYLLYKKLK